MNRFMQSLKKRVIAFALVAVVIAAAGGWWYVSYYTRTPEYSIKMVQEAVSQHDKEKLYKYVDVNHMLDTASDAMLDGLVQAMVPATGDTKEAVSSLTKMFKAPVIMSLQSAVDNYVAQGTWIDENVDERSMAAVVDADMIVNRIGLPNISFQKLESVAVDFDNGTAVAKVQVRQTEAGEDYTLDVELVETDSGIWRVYEITNFKDFIENLQSLRQKHVKAYLDESASLMAQHDAVIAEAEQEIAGLLAGGSLGSNVTRGQIKAVLETKAIPDWQARKAELEAMEVPDAAGSLHRLRLKICDARIEAAANYAKWMEDKKAATIRASDSSLRMAKTLEKDAELLTKQVNAHVR